ncbi:MULTISPECIES: hypothetical protein [Spirulina sp. CCY15215]|uniref:hypothetical protein n=1 Tax=Spirulina sp. CCY15215 TaxID=2767591 RepID=UPI00194F62BE|nr:hypothetical protein [Spirulina major]
MARTKSIVHYVAVSDLSQPPEEHQGFRIEVEGRGGDTEKNREKALEIVNQKWENGEIAEDKFPDGITRDNIFYVPPQSAKGNMETTDQELLPIVQGAQEIVQLTKLQIEVQEAAEEASPYTPIIEVILDRSRPLSSEEKDLAKDKKYGKIIERVGVAIANQEEFRENCTGNGKLILNAIAWNLESHPLLSLKPESEESPSKNTEEEE